MAQPEVPAGVVEAGPENQIIVVSAPGAGPKTSNRVTEQLQTYADTVKTGNERAIRAERDDMVSLFDTLYDGLCESDRSELRNMVATQLTPGHRDTKAYFESRGEASSAAYFARYIGAECLQPEVYFHGDGTVNYPKTKSAIREQTTGRRGKIVIGGYFGLDEFGRTWLLGPGGSDRTGALYGGALGVPYHNFTDVHGIYTAPPKYVQAAYSVGELTRREVREGANAGSQVLQGDTIVDLDEFDTNGVVISVKKASDPHGPHTLVVPDSSYFERRNVADEIARQKPVVALSARDDLTVINIDDLGMAEAVGYLSPILDKMRKLGLSLANLPSAEDFASITLHRTEQNGEAIADLVDFTRGRLLRKSGAVTVEDMGVVTLIGEGLRDRRMNAEVIARTLGSASMHNISATPLPGLNSPSASFLVTHPNINGEWSPYEMPSDSSPTRNLLKIIHKLELEPVVD